MENNVEKFKNILTDMLLRYTNNNSNWLEMEISRIITETIISQNGDCNNYVIEKNFPLNSKMISNKNDLKINKNKLRKLQKERFEYFIQINALKNLYDKLENKNEYNYYSVNIDNNCKVILYIDQIIENNTFAGFKVAIEISDTGKNIVETIIKKLKLNLPNYNYLYEELNPYDDPYYNCPSLDYMYTQLMLFADKPSRIPIKALSTPPECRTEKDINKIQTFLDSIIEEKAYPERINNEWKNITTTIAKVENKDIKAINKIDVEKLKEEQYFLGCRCINESLAEVIERTFGIEGLRHLLAIIWSLSEKNNKRYNWDVKEHLKKLGYKMKNGSYPKEEKEKAIKIIKMLPAYINENVTITVKGKKKEIKIGNCLFYIGDWYVDTKDLTDVKFNIYPSKKFEEAFANQSEKSAKYFPLMKQLVQENHIEHGITIKLNIIFSLLWRFNPNVNQYKMSVKTLMNHCNLDYRTLKEGAKDDERTKRLKKLESELDYMVNRRYLGKWSLSPDRNLKLSNVHNPFDHNIYYEPPKWFKTYIEEIVKTKSSFTEKKKVDNINFTAKSDMSTDRFKNLRKEIMKKTNLKYEEFSKEMGFKSKSVISKVENRKSGIVAKNIWDKILKLYEEKMVN